MVIKNCLFCGKLFEGNAKAQYCSGSHRVLAYRQRKGLPLTPIWLGKSSPEVDSLRAKIAQLEQVQAVYLAEIADLRTQISLLGERNNGDGEIPLKAEIRAQIEDLGPFLTSAGDIQITGTDLKIGTIRHFVSFKSGVSADMLRDQGHEPSAFYELIRQGEVVGPVTDPRGRLLFFKTVKTGKKWVIEKYSI